VIVVLGSWSGRSAQVHRAWKGWNPYTILFYGEPLIQVFLTFTLPIYVQILSEADTKIHLSFILSVMNLLVLYWKVNFLLGQAPCQEDMESGEISVVHVAEWIIQCHRENTYSNHWIGGWVLLRAFLDVVVDTKVTFGARNWILVI